MDDLVKRLRAHILERNYYDDHATADIEQQAADALVSLTAALEGLVDAADSYAFSTCQEFCVHGSDDPESCPMTDKRIVAARAALREVGR